MPKIVDNKIYHNGEKIGWIDGHHVRDKSDAKLGYFQGNDIWDESATRKIAYIQENMLKFENGNASVSLEKINEEIQGTYPLIVKCAVHVLLED
jgi:hypothetical protein